VNLVILSTSEQIMGSLWAQISISEEIEYEKSAATA